MHLLGHESGATLPAIPPELTVAEKFEFISDHAAGLGVLPTGASAGLVGSRSPADGGTHRRRWHWRHWRLGGQIWRPEEMYRAVYAHADAVSGSTTTISDPAVHPTVSV